ncbi:MAG: BMP family ABC transporter substrate-binding protein [Oscillospiraceae bacterium]|jgi:basic membrane protein A|nr:BMP family ABC transporter substrate-binding protein [Oscillospiraceae bacterium]
MKRMFLTGLAVCLLLTILAGCYSKDSGDTADKATESIKISVVTDTGGRNDQGFNQSAWEGLQALEKEHPNVEISCIESKQAADYGPNIEQAVEAKIDLILGIGFSLGDDLEAAAAKNPEISFGLFDCAIKNLLNNTTGVTFNAQEASFLAGAAGAKTTKTNNMGFVGGMKVPVIDAFEFGFRGGSDYVAKELGKTITVHSNCVQSFSDAAKGKATAFDLFNNKGCDVVFAAAGGSGNGALEAAAEAGKLAIGVDRDQSSLAPKNVLTSAIKDVGRAVKLVCEDYIKGGATAIGGANRTYGLKDGCVGLPEKNPNMAPEVVEYVKKVEEKIKKGEITPPKDEASYNEFVKTLK